jgi:polysaccharide biosynthesis/export protein
LRDGRHHFRDIFLFLTLCCSVGCAEAVVRRTLPSPVISLDRDSLPPDVLKGALDVGPELPGERDGEAYRVGPGDTILVAVYGHPELSIASYGAPGLAASNPRMGGLVVDNDGTIQFPLIGSVQVSGKNAGQMRVFLEQELARYIKDPKVTVQVAFTGSIRYYLLGQFTQPGLKYSDRPLDLLEALSLGGSVDLERASLRTAYVARGDKRLPINFRRLVREGDLKQNIRLRTGDVIVVPDNTGEQAFVFGATSDGNNRGGAISFRNGRLDLLQALAQAGFGFRERTQARLSRTHIIRSEGDQAELFVVDASAILAGEAAPFPLAPGDVVFVPPKGITTWNQALQQLLPTLSTVSAVLNPFVQLQIIAPQLFPEGGGAAVVTTSSGGGGGGGGN